MFCRLLTLPFSTPKSDGWPAEAGRLKLLFPKVTVDLPRLAGCLTKLFSWVVPLPKSDGWPARFCRWLSNGWKKCPLLQKPMVDLPGSVSHLTCHIWKVYPREMLWMNLPALAGQWSLFPTAVYGRNSQMSSKFILLNLSSYERQLC